MANDSSYSYLDVDWDAVIEPYLYSTPERYSIYIFLPIVVFIGIIGNVSTIIIISTDKRMRSSLNIYLLNLAISDCLFIVVASIYTWVNIIDSPIHIFYDNTIVPVEYCALNTFVVDSTYTVSATLIMAISVERFLAITMPLTYRSYVSKKRTIKICCTIWIVALLFQSRNVVTSGISDHAWPWPDNWNGARNVTWTCILCSYDFDYKVCKVLYSILEYEFMLYLLYLALMIPLYLTICCFLFNPFSNKKQEISSASNRTNYERKALTTVIVTVVIYVILTAPHNALWIYTFKSEEVNYDLVVRFSNVFRYLAFINSSINPIIYNVSNESFRKAFLELYGFSSKTVQKGNSYPGSSTRTSVSTISTGTSL